MIDIEIRSEGEVEGVVKGGVVENWLCQVGFSHKDPLHLTSQVPNIVLHEKFERVLKWLTDVFAFGIFTTDFCFVLHMNSSEYIQRFLL